MFVIETQHRRVPWRWIILLNIIGQARVLVLFASGGLVFTMKKFVDSPILINSVSSFDIVFNLLISAPCLYYSDRIWTKYGRRLPFILVSMLVLSCVLIFLPLMTSAVPLFVMIILWLAFWDLGATFDILVMEIVPPEQRGRSAAIGSWMFNGLIIISSIVIGGRFDDVITRETFTLNGETFSYWFGAMCGIFCILAMMFLIKERPPTIKADISGGMSLKASVSNLFVDRSLWPVYFLAFSTVLMSVGLGAIDPLLMTTQWGYSKQDMGTNIFVGGMINLLIVIPLVGFFADRVSRLKMFTFGVVSTLLLQIGYYIFVMFILPDRRPSMGHIIIFGQLLSTVGQFSGIALQPLIFEYIPRNKMGSAQAGLNFVRSLTSMLTVNGIGIWVALYSKWFLPEGKYDYFSGYLFMIFMNIIGCAILVSFAIKVKKGVIKPLGLEGYQDLDNKEQPTEKSP